VSVRLPPLRPPRGGIAARDFAAGRLGSRDDYWGAVEELEGAYAAANAGGTAILVPSGRDGLRLVLSALRRSGRTRVVLPAYGDRSVIETVLGLGFEAVPCDVRRADATLDPDRLEEALATVRPAAVISVRLFGHPCDHRVAALAAAHDVPLLEDCAHAPISPPGERGEVCRASFTSFALFKLIDCGGGGMVLTADRDLAAQVRAAARRHPVRGAGAEAWHALVAAGLRVATAAPLWGLIGHPLFRSLGGGALPAYKRYVRPWLKPHADEDLRPLPGLPSLRAGLRQVDDLPERLAARRQRAALLRVGLPPGLLLRSDRPASSAEYAAIACLPDAKGALGRLLEAGLAALPAPMVCYAGAGAYPVPVARRLAAEAIQLPWYDDMTEADVGALRAALCAIVGAAPAP
jgi:dTDP-4-amino-4,6-dideoxygalactose transaminase